MPGDCPATNEMTRTMDRMNLDRSKRRRGVTALAVGLALIASACGGSTASAPASTSGAAAAAATQNDGQGDAEFGLYEAEIVKRVDAVEALIAQCMTDQGFEYVAVDYDTARLAMDSNSEPTGVSPEEFLSQYGYGVTTLATAASQQGTAGLGPNVAIRNGLPTADAVAWDRALLGQNTAQTFIVALDNEDLTQTGGCTRDAVAVNFSKAELGAGFVNYQDSDDARVDEDPRVLDAFKAWSGCMRDAGFSYGNPDEIETALTARLEQIVGDGSMDSLDASSQAALQELQGEERSTAASDKSCEATHIDTVKTAVELEILGPDAGN